MIDRALLLALQHGDSFFPSGAVAFSWGLEGLVRDGLVRDKESLFGFVESQLLGRWQNCDLPAVLAAYAARGDLQSVAAVDAALDALTLPTQLRLGSRRSASTPILATRERVPIALWCAPRG
jgi:urease accessory protein